MSTTPDTDPNEMVYIKHPDIDPLGGPVTRRALEMLYVGKGWAEASAEQVADFTGANAVRATEIEEIVADDEALDTLTAEVVDGTRKRPDLDEIALARGIDASLFDNMDALRDAIKATL